MKKYFPLFIAAAFIAVIAIGCASSPAKFYTLNATVMKWASPGVNCAVVVGPITIPAEVDRPQFTVQVAPNRVAIDEFNRWAAPLPDNIARVVAENLAALLGSPRVTVASSVNFNPAYRVAIDIEKFESVPGQSVQIMAAWLIRKSAGGIVTGVTQTTEPVTGEGCAALAAALSRALARVSDDIAAAIRASGGSE